MVERIRALLQARNLTPTQFADSIGVARPIISHILSGRNKPSLEVVQKIIGAFPDLSLPWLLNGQGPMLPPNKPAEATLEELASLASNKTRSVAEPPAKRIRAAAPVPAVADPAPVVAQAANTGNLGPNDASTPSLPTQTAESTPLPLATPTVATPSSNSVAAFAEPGKKIRRIVIFYHDGTFSDFTPE
ncbi:helix-turn-helix domain-containing protein [Hymenobacter metallicola]|uniref:XRE family transcriptional regulator n=1 Tax=Hymenobacter metallicola TaxID=2563114 RepID=A0A4Z0QE46_9BACT|nr:XRE family transcriptional regulator [Hymenobacter metallicola]